MTAIKLIYFDIDRSRGEECRLALHVAGVAFEDHRLASSWRELKPHTPFGALPVLEVAGKGQLGQSNAILTWIGRSYGIHPDDLWEAARHEALMAFAEELRERFEPLLDIKDPDEKRRAREAFVTSTLLPWGERVERQIGDGPFLAGTAISVADIKLYMMTRWFESGRVDHVPADVLAGFPKLMRLFAAVDAHPGVRGWYALRQQMASPPA